MNPQQELADLKRRMAGAESELAQLKLRFNALEAAVNAESAVTVEKIPPSAVAAPVLAAPPPAAPVSTRAFEPPVLAIPPGAIVRLAPPKPTVSDWSRVRAGLQALQIWPPSGEGNTEVQLGAWWATRI